MCNENAAVVPMTSSEAIPTALSGKELVSRALRGLPTPRPAAGPLAVHYCARLAGVSLRDYTLNPRVLADCVLRYYEAFRPDAVWLSADTWVTAQAMGAAVAFPSGDQPLAGDGRAVRALGRRHRSHSAARSQRPRPLAAHARSVAAYSQRPGRRGLRGRVLRSVSVFAGLRADGHRAGDDADYGRSLDGRGPDGEVRRIRGGLRLGPGRGRRRHAQRRRFAGRSDRSATVPRGGAAVRAARDAGVEIARQRAGFAAHLRQRHADPGRHGRRRAPTCWNWTIRSTLPRPAGRSGRRLPSGAISIRWPCWPREPRPTFGGRPATCWMPSPPAVTSDWWSVPGARSPPIRRPRICGPCSMPFAMRAFLVDISCV